MSINPRPGAGGVQLTPLGESLMDKANAKQVGGQHYKTAIEHWDWVVANDLNYFEGQITKYVARCRKKNGIEDLMKAKHFIEKYIEVFPLMAGPVEVRSNSSGQVTVGAAES